MFFFHFLVNRRRPKFVCITCDVFLRNFSEFSQNFLRWTSYVNMLRIFKHQNFPFQLKYPVANQVTYSSEPGYLVSGDDYYITNAYPLINFREISITFPKKIGDHG